MDDAVSQLDSVALAPWLESHVEGFHDLMEVRKFSGGQSNPTFLITAQSGKYVLRAKPPGESQVPRSRSSRARSHGANLRRSAYRDR